MKLVKVTAGLLAAAFVAGPQAATLLAEGFGDVPGLTASGWVFTNASASAGSAWFQGNSGVFTAAAGAADSYAAVNFNSSTATQGVIDNWLISPELAVGSGSTLTFLTRASDAGFFDRIELRFSSGSGSDLAGFSSILTSVGSTSSASYPVGSWVAYSAALPTAASGRFAFRYTVANALDASYVGIDSLTVSAVPEPATMALFGAGLAALGAAARRRALPV